MNRPGISQSRTTFFAVLVVIAVLYLARTILIPLALALLLAFLLGPLVSRLRLWGLGRLPSTLSVVALCFAFLGVIGALMASQLGDLARKLPEYQQNVEKKLTSIRTSGGGVVSRASRVISNFTEDLLPPNPAPAGAPGTAAEKPVPVEIHGSTLSPLNAIQKVLGSMLSFLVTGLLVLVFVIFMLMQREDLRDRLIRLGGQGRVNLTTRVLDDAAHRVSRYLVAQVIVNTSYGIMVGTALYFLKVPNPLLWGVVAALLRYIPYIGIWVAALLPAAVAFAVEPGWLKAPAIVAIYFGIDLLMYNLIEPYLYGASTGVSPLAIFVAAVFWAWLWGPVGLLLSTPLTVCVVVVGRHVPRLEFLRVLLSDEPMLAPETRFYQRLLAGDFDEADAVAQDFLKGKSVEELYDQLLVPALNLAEQDRHSGRLDATRQRFVFQSIRSFVDQFGEDLVESTPGAVAPGGKSGEPRSVLCVPARDAADEIAALMLAQLVNRRGVSARALSSAELASELIEKVEVRPPSIACICAVPPFGYNHARYLSRRLRTNFQHLKLVGVILTGGEVEELKRRDPALPVDQLTSNLRQSLALVLSLLPTRLTPVPLTNPERA